MSSIAESDFDWQSGPSDAGLPISQSEQFVTRLYVAVDNATARELDRQHGENGVVPTCTLGCCHCCRFHVVLNVAEAHTLARYIKRVFSADQIDAIRMRTLRWHEWDDSRPGRSRTPDAGDAPHFAGYQHFCPLLLNGCCSVYPVRPMVCRTHYVTSDARYCDAANNPQKTEDPPVALLSVVNAASLFSGALREYIESTGRDFSRSNMLLPHWLAIQMDWDFAIAP